MFGRLGALVARRWPWVILFWIALPLALRVAAPDWSTIAQDGDLAHLPSDMKSVHGERLLAEAFPVDQSKSQIVVVVAREDAPLTSPDEFAASDLARRYFNALGASNFRRALEMKDAPALESEMQIALEIAEQGFNRAVEIDQEMLEYRAALAESGFRSHAESVQRLATAYHNRALLYDFIEQDEKAEQDRKIAYSADASLAEHPDLLLPIGISQWPLVDVWTWNEKVIGEKLQSANGKALLIVLQLSNEFMATDNVRVLEKTEDIIDRAWSSLHPGWREGLKVRISGSAAIGGDLVRTADRSISNTEVCTVVLVLLILLLVYRSPLLALVPLLCIGVSLVASMNLVALLTQLDELPGFGWWDLRVFTTTRIFIVVILFGAGTDYCLFLIARFKEELDAGRTRDEAVRTSLSGVGDALTASALTTILGLGMMFFADFGKFRDSGPTIGLCLSVTLAACLTLAPALLRGFGSALFWPGGAHAPQRKSEAGAAFWSWLAGRLIRRPGLILLVTVGLLAPLAGWGVWRQDHVTYDFLQSLSSDSPSREGAELLQRHFPIGESGPLTIVAHREDAGLHQTDEQTYDRIGALADQLYLEGVASVRNLDDPLGKFPPGTPRSFYDSESWRYWAMRPQQRTEQLFVSHAPGYLGEVTRLEVILENDPFSDEAAATLRRIDAKLRQISQDESSFWHGATFAYAGTTAGIADLREVTQTDSRRIQVLVVTAVFLVLLVILRHPWVCIYMMVSVLFSYFVTLGATDLFFAWVYGASYQGMDWKAPLFLFVILVAIGQDYNVYLATRVFEEQKRLGPFDGLREAVARTGGIITSCGVIMAGAFVSMTSGAWSQALPDWMIVPFGFGEGGSLRSIVELGFALSLGVLLDTFIVRSILLPAFLAVLCRFKSRSRPAGKPASLERAVK